MWADACTALVEYFIMASETRRCSRWTPSSLKSHLASSFLRLQVGFLKSLGAWAPKIKRMKCFSSCPSVQCAVPCRVGSSQLPPLTGPRCSGHYISTKRSVFIFLLHSSTLDLNNFLNDACSSPGGKLAPRPYGAAGC